MNCSIPEEGVVVFIDDNRIELGSLGTPPALPESRGRKLLSALVPLVSSTFEDRLSPWKTARLPYFDSAFNMSIRPDRANGTLEQGKSNIDEKAVRESFLKFFVAIMKNYRKYLIYPSKEVPNPLINFQQKDFIAEHPSDWVEFLRSVLPTQAFCQFCDARISSSSLKDADIRFFDESIEAKHNRYTFRFFSVDTPFLNDQSSKHIKTVVAAAPNVEGLPGAKPDIMDSDIWMASASGMTLSSTSLASGSNESSSSTNRKQSVAGSKKARDKVVEVNSVELSESALRAASSEGSGSRRSQKLEEPLTYVYDNFPKLKSELYALPKDSLKRREENTYHMHTKKELREIKANPFTAAPLKSNDIVADLFSNKLKRIPHYKHRLQDISQGMGGIFSRSNSNLGTRTRSNSGGSSWFRNAKPQTHNSQRNFARRGSTGKDSSFSEVASLENANACTHNAFLTLLCFVISKNKSLPAVRRAPPATMKLIDEYGKGISDAVRGSTINYNEDDGIRKTYSAVLSTNSILRGSMVRRSNSFVREGDFGRETSDSDLRASAISVDLSGVISPPKTGLSGANISHISDPGHATADYDSDCDLDSSRGFKHMSDNIREETMVASKAGLKMAFEVLYVMTEKGLPPDELTYRSLAECCAVCGDGHCAIDLLEDMMYWGYLPDPDITSSVVQAMLHSSARDISYSSSDASESIPAAFHSGDRKYGATFVTARDVLDAVNTNQLQSLRDRLENRVDEDVHTYASEQSNRRKKTENDPHSFSGSPASLKITAEAREAPETPLHVNNSSHHKSDSLASGESPRVATRLEDVERSHSATSTPSKHTAMDGSSSRHVVKKRDAFLDTHEVPTSLRLTTHLLLADRILDMQFPDLKINLNDPFGTFCPNPKCGKSHTLSQLRAGWDGVDPNKYTTRCVHCSREFVPRFTVHSSCSTWLVEEIDLMGQVPEDYGQKGSDELLWCEFLSPWVLRKELLMILLNDGIDRVLSADFRRPVPSNSQNLVIFWNMVVAFRGCGLPYQFMISETLSTAFLVPLG